VEGVAHLGVAGLGPEREPDLLAATRAVHHEVEQQLARLGRAPRFERHLGAVAPHGERAEGPDAQRRRARTVATDRRRARRPVARRHRAGRH
jgi:hypothetical protein